MTFWHIVLINTIWIRTNVQSTSFDHDINTHTQTHPHKSYDCIHEHAAVQKYRHILYNSKIKRKLLFLCTDGRENVATVFLLNSIVHSEYPDGGDACSNIVIRIHHYNSNNNQLKLYRHAIQMFNLQPFFSVGISFQWKAWMAFWPLSAKLVSRTIFQNCHRHIFFHFVPWKIFKC